MLKITEKPPLRLKKLVYTTLLAMLPAACPAAPNEAPPPQSSQPAKPPVPAAKESKIQKSLSLYLNLMRNDDGLSKAPLGSWRKGEIEIVLNPDQIKKVENQTKLRLISRGATETEAEKWSSVGIVAEDNYWMWIRDAVIFPSGVYGTYDRLLWKSGMDGIPGVAVLPILANKKIVVNLNYRHATRSWEIELPRGQKKEGETLEQAALRELKEETGYQLTKCTLLGTTAPDSGALMSLTPLFHGGDLLLRRDSARILRGYFSKSRFHKARAEGRDCQRVYRSAHPRAARPRQLPRPRPSLCLNPSRGKGYCNRWFRKMVVFPQGNDPINSLSVLNAEE